MATTTDDLWLMEPRQMDHFASMLARADLSALLDRKPVEPASRKEGRAAVVPITGPLTKNLGLWQAMFGGSSYTGIADAVSRAAADPLVNRIVLHIDSPGGGTNGVELAAAAIRAAGKAKPVSAFIDGLGASAGYWLASQATKIFAGDNLAQVGSIGVRLVLLDSSKLFEQSGVRPVVIDTGAKKSIGVPGRPISDADEKYLRSRVEVAFQEFRSAVVTGRRLSPSQFAAVSDGGVFSAAEAQKLKLIDGIKPFGEVVGLRPPELAEMSASSPAADFASALESYRASGKTYTDSLRLAIHENPVGHRAWLTSQQPQNRK